MEFQSAKIGELSARVFKHDEAVKTATVFLHGAGANMDDLVPLADYLPSLKNGNMYFLNAPFEMMPPYPMYIWFNVGELVEKMASTGFSEDIVKTFVPTRIEEGRKHLKTAMASIRENYETINIIGFSQGGMMTLDYALSEEKIGKIGLLSTSICDYQYLLSKIENGSKKFEIFQSHGDSDQILPFQYGEYLKNFLDDKGFKVRFETFKGGHEIPLEILQKLDKFLDT